MGPEEYSKGVVLIFGGLGAAIRLLRWPPKSTARSIATLLSGPIVSFALCPTVNRILFASSLESLALVALVFGVLGMSLLEGLYTLGEKNKEQWVKAGAEKLAPGLTGSEERDTETPRALPPPEGDAKDREEENGGTV